MALLAPEPRQRDIGVQACRAGGRRRSGRGRWRSAPPPAAPGSFFRMARGKRAAQSPIAEMSGSAVSSCASTEMPFSTLSPAAAASSSLGTTPMSTMMEIGRQRAAVVERDMGTLPPSGLPRFRCGGRRAKAEFQMAAVFWCALRPKPGRGVGADDAAPSPGRSARRYAPGTPLAQRAIAANSRPMNPAPITTAWAAEAERAASGAGSRRGCADSRHRRARTPGSGGHAVAGAGREHEVLVG